MSSRNAFRILGTTLVVLGGAIIWLASRVENNSGWSTGNPNKSEAPLNEIVINAAESEVEVLLNGDLSVREAMSLSFSGGETELHGIRRVIPVTRQFDDLTSITTELVNPQILLTDAIEFLPITIEHLEGGTSLKIGDPEKTLTSTPAIFEIKFQIKGGIQHLPDMDRVVWSFADYIPTEIRSLKILIRFPSLVEIHRENVRAFIEASELVKLKEVEIEGKLKTVMARRRETDTVNIGIPEPNTVTVDAKRILKPGENLRVEVDFPAHFIKREQVEQY